MCYYMTIFNETVTALRALVSEQRLDQRDYFPHHPLNIQTDNQEFFSSAHAYLEARSTNWTQMVILNNKQFYPSLLEQLFREAECAGGGQLSSCPCKLSSL